MTAEAQIKVANFTIYVETKLFCSLLRINFNILHLCAIIFVLNLRKYHFFGVLINADLLASKYAISNSTTVDPIMRNENPLTVRFFFSFISIEVILMSLNHFISDNLVNCRLYFCVSIEKSYLSFDNRWRHSKLLVRI